jgi:hypothetical protein
MIQQYSVKCSVLAFCWGGAIGLSLVRCFVFLQKLEENNLLQGDEGGGKNSGW